jgi:hypothetical protein
MTEKNPVLRERVYEDMKDGAEFTISELVERYGVKECSLYSTFSLIRAMGYNIVRVDGKKYKMVDDETAERIRSEREANRRVVTRRSPEEKQQYVERLLANLDAKIYATDNKLARLEELYQNREETPVMRARVNMYTIKRAFLDAQKSYYSALYLAGEELDASEE